MSKISRHSFSSTMFDCVLYLGMIIFCISTVYPFLYLLSLSLSASDVSFTQIYIIPPRIDFISYKQVLQNELIAYGFYNTMIRTFFGTLLTLIATVLMAYPLSKKSFPNRIFWTGLIVFTMYFHGGLIPTYLLVKKLNMVNTIWALVLPNLIAAFHLIIVRNFFMTIPDSLEESARIDGANDVVILFRIILPISMPIIATLVLWTAVWHWNAWFDSLIYMSNSKKQVLQNVMRSIVLQGSGSMMSESNNNEELINPENLKAATIMVTCIPIIIVYPFLQKYFVKGMLVGSLKG